MGSNSQIPKYSLLFHMVPAWFQLGSTSHHNDRFAKPPNRFANSGWFRDGSNMVPLSSALVHAYLGRTLPQTLSVSATREGGLADSQGLVKFGNQH